MKKVLVLFLMVVTIFVAKGTTSVEAAVNELASLEDMGTYTITEPVMTRVKIYIDEDRVGLIESTGKTVYTQETKHYIFGIYINSTYKYYFYEDKFVDTVVEQRQLYNDVDTLIYMITELEELADDYGCSSVENCVLGYVRSINVNYSDNSSMYAAWGITAGTTNMGFVDYVDQEDGSGTDFNDFFAQFLPFKDEYNEAGEKIPDGKNDYYNTKFGYVSNYYKNRELSLQDPFNGPNSTEIDVTHLFASIDGAYQNTGNTVNLGNQHQQDLAGWLGDLHTFAKKLYTENADVSDLSLSIDVSYGYANSNIDFCDWVGIVSCTFPEEDMLADVDAMNIAKIFLDIEENTLSNSLSAYYNVISGDDSQYPNRYKMFKESAQIYANSTSSSQYYRFRDEVYKSLNVEYSGGTYSNHSYYSGNFYAGYSLLRTAGYGSNIVPYEYREYAARLFYNYICAMSSAPYYY